MIEKEHVIRTIKEIIKGVQNRDTPLLRSLSNHTIHSASIYQDPDAVALAVTAYALSKVVERENYHHYPEWKQFLKSCVTDLEKAITGLEQDNIGKFRKAIIRIRESITKMGSKLKDYISEVFRKAAINKASRIYEHGISRAETAKILGITQWELAEYVGRTGIADIDLSVTKTIKERLKLAEKLFK